MPHALGRVAETLGYIVTEFEGAGQWKSGYQGLLPGDLFLAGSGPDREALFPRVNSGDLVFESEVGQSISETRGDDLHATDG
jgi:hypothetical protein